MQLMQHMLVCENYFMLLQRRTGDLAGEHAAAQVGVVGVLQVEDEAAVLGLVARIHAAVLPVHRRLRLGRRRAGVRARHCLSRQQQCLCKQLPRLVPVQAAIGH